MTDTLITSRPFKIPLSVLVVIHTPALDVLLIRRADAGTWQSVTGAKNDPSEGWSDTAVREVADQLEGLIADDLWPLPKYQEMLFVR